MPENLKLSLITWIYSSFYAFHRIIDTGIGITSTVFVTVIFKFLEDKLIKSP